MPALWKSRSLFQGRGWGVLLLAVWLIAMGLLPMFGFSGEGIRFILHVLAVVAGILLILDR